MKHLLILEAHESEALLRGEPFNLTLPGGEKVGIVFERERNGAGSAMLEAPEKPRKVKRKKRVAGPGKKVGRPKEATKRELFGGPPKVPGVPRETKESPYRCEEHNLTFTNGRGLGNHRTAQHMGTSGGQVRDMEGMSPAELDAIKRRHGVASHA